jgi:3-hydroxyisobutyrate dehydrogenase-like beta-hydroxyacid dehydrogenase
MTAITTIGLLGYGEVGQTLAGDLRRCCDAELIAYDRLFATQGSAPCAGLDSQPYVTAAASPEQLARRSDLIISAVTAAQDIIAAESIAGAIRDGAFFLDLNSVSAETKHRCAILIDTAGGRYVEAAVLSPIQPLRIASPILLGGPNAQEFLPLSETLGFSGASVFSTAIGGASAVKMCRSIVIKGLEALFTECLVTARQYGVEEDVIASLDDLLTSRNCRSLAQYMLERSIMHGVRRAEEMREVVTTVAASGVDPWMSEACVNRQQWAAQFSAALEHDDLASILDSIRSEMTC